MYPSAEVGNRYFINSVTTAICWI